MIKVFKYSFYDMIRNRWLFAYTLLFLLITIGLLLLSTDLPKVVISLTNIVLIITPMIGVLLGCMYFYNSKEYMLLLLAQPINRTQIFIGMYLGLMSSLCVSVILGMCLPLIFYGIFGSDQLGAFLILSAMAIVLSFIFSLFGFLIALRNENRIKGFGKAIFTWLFFAVLYDGIFLLLLLNFKDYPLEKLTLGLTMFNPIDLARILIILKMDIAAMMGYTGAVLEKIMGSASGSIMIVTVLLLWMIIPFVFMLRNSKRKDF